MVGRLAAEILRGVVRDGATVGIGDGASVSATAAALEETATPVAVTVVPLCGGYWSTGPEREPYRRVAEALDGQARGLMAPGLVDDAATQRSLVAHAGVRSIIDLWGRLDVAFYGIGGPAWNTAQLGADVDHALETADAVGEILIAPFDLDGRFVCPALRERVLAFDARGLGRVPVSIGVAAGDEQGPADPRRASCRASSGRSSRMSRRPRRWSRSTRPRRRQHPRPDEPDDRARAGDPGARSRDDRGQGGSCRSGRASPGARPERLRARRVGWPWLGRTGSRRLVVGGRQRGPRASVPGHASRSPRSASTGTDRRSSRWMPGARRPDRRSPSSTPARPPRRRHWPRGPASVAGRSAACPRRCGSSGTSRLSPRRPAGTSRPGSGWPSA